MHWKAGPSSSSSPLVDVEDVEGASDEQIHYIKKHFFFAMQIALPEMAFVHFISVTHMTCFVLTYSYEEQRPSS